MAVFFPSCVSLFLSHGRAPKLLNCIIRMTVFFLSCVSLFYLLGTEVVVLHNMHGCVFPPPDFCIIHWMYCTLGNAMYATIFLLNAFIIAFFLSKYFLSNHISWFLLLSNWLNYLKASKTLTIVDDQFICFFLLFVCSHRCGGVVANSKVGCNL